MGNKKEVTAKWEVVLLTFDWMYKSKITNNLSEDSRSANPDSNLAPIEYEAGNVTTRTAKLGAIRKAVMSHSLFVYNQTSAEMSFMSFISYLIPVPYSFPLFQTHVTASHYETIALLPSPPIFPWSLKLRERHSYIEGV
jgi:hypothetical protein